MRVLVACEFSGTVRRAFRKQGHDAYSCDLRPSLDDSKYHLRCDVLNVLDDGWDLMIAHPPCTHLAVSGARHFHKKKKRQSKALDFFLSLLNADIPYVCVENPVSISSSRIRPPDQIIQPWQFGDSYQKTTCLWLENLRPLTPTKIVDKGEFQVLKSGKRLPTWYSNADKKTRSMIRSTTFPGIAYAMATQWSDPKPVGFGIRLPNRLK